MPGSCEYLGSHVLYGATEGVSHLRKYQINTSMVLHPGFKYRLFINGFFAKAEISELHMAGSVKKDVLRLQVAVNNALKRE